MKKLLLQLDGSDHPSVFDRVVAFDGGADEVMSYGSVTPDAVPSLVQGAIFTRGPADLHHTAIFIGGTDMSAGERLLAAVTATFFGPFRVSVMLDANGANTTAVAACARIRESLGDIRGRRAVVVAGSGPVGSRVAGLLARDGADVVVTSRSPADGALASRIGTRFHASVTEAVLRTSADADSVLENAEVVVNAGPAGVNLVPRSAWTGRGIMAIVDLNAVPPAGIEGVDPTDKATSRDGAIAFGALGVGSLKMKVHRACIARLFEQNTVILDAETIAEVARELSASPR